jgi:hypothetical protein
MLTTISPALSKTARRRDCWRCCIEANRHDKAEERARLLIEQAEARGEPPDDPLLLFSVLYGIWVAKVFASDLEVARDLAAQFLAMAESQGAIAPLMIGHRL